MAESPRRSSLRPSRSRTPPSQRRRGGSGERDKSTSPIPSPGSWQNVERGRSKTRRPSSSYGEEGLRRRGYHALQSSFGKIFHVEKRWKLVREMGSGAYGFVIAAADDISGETVAIKLVTRLFEKVQLAKRALREVTLLRHLANHENITGLIDVDVVHPGFNELYLFMEPMEADLHQIIKSGQQLTNEHVQYFIYQVLRGMKYVHSANVVHRDLKPGNLLVNADCELKICDFGLARGFDASPADDSTNLMTEYVATRWYRAPEIMLAFRRYGTAIDVWSIGCILAELFMGKPVFKGKDYVDQLNKIIGVLGTPEDSVVARIGSEKAQAFIRSLPIKKKIPFGKLIPTADSQGIDLLSKMLEFDPAARISVSDALAHPWLSSYHDTSDEPTCSEPFTKWEEYEKLTTVEELREALWAEVEDYRREVRGLILSDLSGQPIRSISGGMRARVPHAGLPPDAENAELYVPQPINSDEQEEAEEKVGPIPSITNTSDAKSKSRSPVNPRQGHDRSSSTSDSAVVAASSLSAPTDPLVSYARRSTIAPTRRSSFFGSSDNVSGLPTISDEPPVASPLPESKEAVAGLPEGNASQSYFPFPTTRESGFVMPARTRTASFLEPGTGPRTRLLRTLSTMSIHESLPGGLPEVIKQLIAVPGEEVTGADAPASEMPREFREESEDEGSRSSGKKLEVLESAAAGGKEKKFSL